MVKTASHLEQMLKESNDHYSHFRGKYLRNKNMPFVSHFNPANAAMSRLWIYFRTEPYCHLGGAEKCGFIFEISH